MSSGNFVEIWHEEQDNRSNWIATRRRTIWKDGSPELMTAWQIEGSSLHVYDKEDVAALRKLLDALEERMNEDHG